MKLNSKTITLMVVFVFTIGLNANPIENPDGERISDDSIHQSDHHSEIIETNPEEESLIHSNEKKEESSEAYSDSEQSNDDYIFNSIEAGYDYYNDDITTKKPVVTTKKAVATTPHKGGAATTPHKGGAATTPHKGGAATTPHKGGAVTTPHKGGAATTPHKGVVPTKAPPHNGSYKNYEHFNFGTIVIILTAVWSASFQ